MGEKEIYEATKRDFTDRSSSASQTQLFKAEQLVELLISEAGSEYSCQCDHECIQAWFEDLLSQTAMAGEGISSKQFVLGLLVFTDSELEAICRWITFAKECVEQEQFVNFAKKDEQAQPIKLWLETLLAGFLDIHKRYGRQISSKICDLAMQPNCLYPCEMQRAAEYFQNGGSPLNITNMMENGLLEDDKAFFPKLSNRQDFTQVQEEKEVLQSDEPTLQM